MKGFWRVLEKLFVVPGIADEVRVRVSVTISVRVRVRTKVRFRVGVRLGLGLGLRVGIPHEWGSGAYWRSSLWCLASRIR